MIEGLMNVTTSTIIATLVIEESVTEDSDD